MYDAIQNVLQPVIVDYLLWLLIPALAWVFRWVPERFRLDVESRHREALHKAVDTAVGLIFDTVQKHPSVAIPDVVISKGIGYITGSVPDAIKRLGPSQAQIELMLRSKLQVALDEALGRDRLAEALKKAGVGD